MLEEKQEKPQKKPQKKAPAEGAPQAPKKAHKETQENTDSDFVHLVRLSGVVVDGSLTIPKALTKIKGVGPRVAESVLESLSVPKTTKIGSLKENQIAEIEQKLEKIQDLIPHWMVNRKKNSEDGGDIHKIGPELDIQIREDINLQKKIRSYRGVRHQLNLPVRGQRTRSTGRIGGTIGVVRKKEPATAAKPAVKQ